MQNDRACSDAAAMADAYVPKDLCPGTNHDAILDLGMPVAVLLARSAKGDGMEHRHIVANDSRLADNDGMRVVDHDATAHFGGGMNVHTEHFRDPHLNKISKIDPATAPKPVSDPICLDGLIALEEKNGLQEAMARRITIIDRNQIGTRSLSEIRIDGVRLVRYLTQYLLAHLA